MEDQEQEPAGFDDDLDEDYEDEFALEDSWRSEWRLTDPGFLAGLAVGALVGAGLALLWAPEPGTQLRRRLRRKLARLGDEAAGGWEDTREQLRKRLASHRPTSARASSRPS